MNSPRDFQTEQKQSHESEPHECSWQPTMKILEAQSATLTNYEVYTHLKNQKARYEAGGRKRRGTSALSLWKLAIS
jgi:hypothetical protein